MCFVPLYLIFDCLMRKFRKKEERWNLECHCSWSWLVDKVIFFGFELTVEKSSEGMLIYLGIKPRYLCPFFVRIRRKYSHAYCGKIELWSSWAVPVIDDLIVIECCGLFRNMVVLVNDLSFVGSSLASSLFGW